MKKKIFSLAVATLISLSAFCEAPAGWSTMYFNMGELEYCAVDLEGDISAQLELYADALVVSYSAPEKIKGAITLSVGDVTLNGRQGEYGTVFFVIKDKSEIQKFVEAIGDGSTPIVIKSGNKTNTVKFTKEAAKTFPQAYHWIKSIPNAMNYE